MAEQGLMAYGQQVATPKKKEKKKAYITKKKKPYKVKNYDTTAIAAGQQVLTERKGRKDRSKKYNKSSMFPKAREEARKNTAKARPFGVAFKSARAAGKDKFLWKGKSYHTKTKDELEKKIGTSEKERFERKGKSNQVTKKRSFLDKIKSLGSSSEGRADRVKAKRIASMEKRKEEGKSYSKKNLAALKAK